LKLFMEDSLFGYKQEFLKIKTPILKTLILSLSA
jgi:hypothetical protein